VINMGDHDIKKPLLDLYERVINQNDVSAMDDIYGPNYVNHAAPFGLAQDFEGLKKLFVEFVEAFPDQHIVADDLFIFGDKVICRWTLTATHRGAFFGVPATGKKVVMTGIDIERIAEGRIVEHWGGEDMLGLLEQIGAVRPPQLGGR
jgi:steroid delta-isomerase-like uncharacterized protein